MKSQALIFDFTSQKPEYIFCFDSVSFFFCLENGNGKVRVYHYHGKVRDLN